MGRRQILKLDCISENLKPYFMNRNNGDAWTVSFEKISRLFPKLKQIPFMNSYRFDDETLKRLVDWLQRDECKLEQIKFMYYNYNGSLDEKSYFVDESRLNTELLSKLKVLKWRLSFDKNKNARKGFV